MGRFPGSIAKTVLTITFGLAGAFYAFFAALPSATGSDGAAMVWPATAIALSGELDEHFGALTGSSVRPTGLADPRYGRAAAEVLRVEPANFDAMRTLAVHLEMAGQVERTPKRMNAINRLYKRDEALGLWLAQDSLKRGELDTALTHLDRILRTSGDRRGTILSFMTPIISREEARTPLLRILRSNPSWERDFWYAVTRSPASTRNGLILRTALVDTPTQADEQQTAELLMRGIEQGHYDEAGSLYRALTRSGPLDRLRNAAFTAPARFPPFDWELPEGDVNAVIDPASDRLYVGARPTVAGTAARQILRLAPGTYTVTFELADGQEDDVEVAVGLRCLGANGDASPSRNESGREYTVSARCPWQEFYIDMPYDSVDREVVFEQVGLARSRP